MTVIVKSPIVYPISVQANASLRTYNFFIVKNNESLILIDAGVDTDECWDSFNQVLQQNNYEINDLDAIILTHNHADHIGLVNRIREVHDLPLFAHEDAVIRLKRDESFMEKRVQFFKSFYKEMGCEDDAYELLERLVQSIERNKSQKVNGKISTLIAEDEIFGLRVLEVPGHAPDHIALLHEATGVIFVGDHMIKHSSSNALVELGKDGNRTPSLILYEESLKKMLHIPLETAYSGHGETIDEPHIVIREKLNRIERKAEKIKQLVKTPKTAAEVAKSMYKDRYNTLLPLVMSEVVGHLDRLVNRNEVTIEKRNNIIYYCI